MSNGIQLLDKKETCIVLYFPGFLVKFSCILLPITHYLFHIFISKTSFNNKLNYNVIPAGRQVVVKHQA